MKRLRRSLALSPIAPPIALNDLVEIEHLVQGPNLDPRARTVMAVLKVVVLPAEALVLCRTRTPLIEEVKLGTPI